MTVIVRRLHGAEFVPAEIASYLEQVADISQIAVCYRPSTQF
jgi:hypothetical protein